jgi:hypothetical protein
MDVGMVDDIGPGGEGLGLVGLGEGGGFVGSVSSDGDELGAGFGVDGFGADFGGVAGADHADADGCGEVGLAHDCFSLFARFAYFRGLGGRSAIKSVGWRGDRRSRHLVDLAGIFIILLVE